MFEEVERLQAAIQVAIDRYRMEFPVPANPMLLLPAAIPTPANVRLRKAKRDILRVVDRIIDWHDSSSNGANLLSILLSANRDGRVSDGLLRDEVITMLLTGHETTACALARTWYLLAQNPAQLAKLNEEIDAMPERPLTAADLNSLHYTSMVVLESLRLYPPSWGMNRIAVEDCQIGGYRVPAGVSVAMSQWVIHRDARFYSEPELFWPERWSDPVKSPPRGAFFPFGGGQRLCIGKDFAMLHLVLALATIARKYEFQLVPGRVVQPLVSTTLRPKGGILATLHRR